MARGNNIYSIGVDISDAKKELQSLLDQYLEIKKQFGEGFKMDGIEDQISEMKSAIDDLSKTFLNVSKTKVNSSTFTSFDSKVTKQIDDLNQRTTALENTVGKLIGTMSDADSSSFKKWIADVRGEMNGLNEIAEKTTEVFRNVATVSGSKKPIKLVDSESIASTKADLQDLIKRLRAIEDSERESKPIDIKNIEDAKKQLDDASEAAESFKKTLESLSLSDVNYKPTQFKYVAALEHLYDVYGEVLSKFGDNNQLIPQFERAEPLINSSFESEINNIRTQISRLSQISIPIDISTTAKELGDKVSSIISTLQSSAAKSPIEIEFKLVSAKRYTQFGKALDAFQKQVSLMPEEADRTAMESIAKDLQSGMANQITFALKNSLADTAQDVRATIGKIRSELAAQPLVLNPEIKITDEEIANFTAQVNTVAEKLSDVVGKAAEEGLGGKEGVESNTLKALSGEISKVLKALGSIPQKIDKVNTAFATLDQNKMGNDNVALLTENLDKAYASAEKILDLILSFSGGKTNIADGIEKEQYEFARKMGDSSLVGNINIRKDQFDGMFSNTGIESFAESVKTASEYFVPLLNIVGQLANTTWGLDKLGLTSETVSGITNIEQSLSRIADGSSKLKIDTTPLVELTKTLNELSDVIQRYTGISSKSNLESTFKEIQKITSWTDGRASRRVISSIVDQYNQYLGAGGNRSISELTTNKKLQEKLQKEFDSIALQSAKAAEEEAPAMDKVSESATEAAESKGRFTEANQQLFDSIIKSVSEIDNEGKAFENLNKLLNNIGGAKGDEKLTKTKSALEEIYSIMNSSVTADSFIKELENLASSGDALKDLSNVINATRSQLSSAKKVMKEDETTIRRNKSQELLKNDPSGLKEQAEAELKTLYGKEVPYVGIQIDREGFIEAIGYIKDLNASAEDLQVVKMRLDDAQGFITTGISSANVQAMKYQQFLDRLHSAAQLPSHVTDEIVFDKNTDSTVWAVLLEQAEQYYSYIGNLQSVTRQVREDSAGNLLESFSFFGDKGHVTMGREGDMVASHQNLLDIKSIETGFDNLTKSASRYYELKNKNAKNNANEYEIRELKELEDEYARLQDLVKEVNSDIGKDNGAQKALENFNNNFNKNFDQSLQDIIDRFNKTLEKQQQTRGNQRTDFTSSFKQEIEEAKQAVSAINALRQSYKDGQTFWNPNDLDSIYSSIDKINSVMDRFQDRSNIAALTSDVDKLITKLQTDLNNNNIKGAIKDQYVDLLNTLNNVRVDANSARDGVAAIDKVTLGNLQGQFQNLHAEMLKTGQYGKGFLKQFAGSITSQSANFLARYFSFYSIIRYGRQLVQTVNQIDTSMKELQKVSSGTNEQMAQAFTKSTETAKQLGATITDVVNSTADWSRLGYSLPESEELARVTTMYQNIAKGVDQSSASEYLVSTLQGYQMQASQAETIVDSINKVANNFAIDQAGIGEALKRSASSFYAAHTDLNKSIALVTTGNAVLQNPESVGTAFKTLSARLRGAKAELEELGEDEVEVAETTSKLRKEVLAMTGFDIMEEDKETYKDVYDILLGIGEKWKDLTDVQQAALAEDLAGKRMASVLYAVLNNTDKLKEAYATALDSAGSAQEAQDIYASSVQFSIDRAKASLQELSTDFMNSGLLKGVIDLGNNIINVIDKIIKKIGFLGGALGIAGIVGGIKGAANPGNSLLVKGFGSLLSAGLLSRNNSILRGALNSGADVPELTRALQNYGTPELAAAALNKYATAGVVGASWDMGSKVDIMTESFENLDEAGATALLNINNAASTATVGLTRMDKAALALHGLVSSPVFWGIAIPTAVILAYKGIKKHQEDLMKTAKDSAEGWEQSKSSLDDYAKKVTELRERLSDVNLSDSERFSIKQELLNIQQEITNEYGKQAEGINLINGELTAQLGILRSISEQEARDNLRNNKEAYNEAKREITQSKNLNIATVFGTSSQVEGGEEFREQIEKILEEADLNGVLTTKINSANGGLYLNINGNVKDLTKDVDTLLSALDTLRDKFELVENTKGIDAISEIEEQLLDASKDVRKTYEEYGDTYETMLEMEFAKRGGSEKYDAVADAIKRYNEALSSGERDSIENAKKTMDSAFSDYESFAEKYDFDIGMGNLVEQIDTVSEKLYYAKEAATAFNQELTDNNPYKDSADFIQKITDKISSFKLDTNDIRNMLSSPTGQIGEMRVLSGEMLYLRDTFGFTDDQFVQFLINVGAAAENAAEKAKRLDDEFKTFTNEIQKYYSNLDTVNSALVSAATGKGLGVEFDDTGQLAGDIGNIINAYKDLENFNAGDIFRITANGVKLNEKELRKLRKEQDKVVRKKFLKQQKELTNQLTAAQKELARETDKTKIDGHQRAIDAIKEQLAQVGYLEAAYNAATSAYQRWLDAQSAGEQGDVYDNMRENMVSRADELFNEGLTGTEEFRALAELISGKDLSTANVDAVEAAYKNLDASIEGTDQTVRKFFEEGGQGALNFIDAMKDLGYATEENGIVSFEYLDTEEFAKKLGTSVDIVEAALGKLKDYGFDIKWFTKEQTEALKEFDNKYSDTINKYKDMSFGGMKFDLDELDTVDELKSAQASIERMLANPLEYDIDASDAEILNELLSMIIEKTNILEVPHQTKITNVTEYKVAQEAAAKLREEIDAINEAAEKGVKLELSDEGKEIAEWLASLDASDQQLILDIEPTPDSQKLLENLGLNIGNGSQQQKKPTIKTKAERENIYAEKHINTETNITNDETHSEVTFETSGEEETNQKIDEVQANAAEGANLTTTSSDEGVDQTNQKIDEVQKNAAEGANVNVDASDKEVTEAKRKVDALIGNGAKTLKLDIIVPNNNLLLSFKNIWDSLKSKTITLTYRRNGNNEVPVVNGTAHAFGTAYTGGKWGLPSNQKALINEVGPEMVVRGSNWFIPNNGRPTMDFPLRKGDIIFNAKQTEELLKNGYVTRGYAHADGTVGGIAYAGATGSGATDRLKRKTSSSSSSSSSSKSSSSSSSSDSQKAAEEAADEVKDWIEVLLDRITRAFENFQEMSDYWSSYVNKNRELNNAITQAQTNITQNQKAYARYMKQANSVGLSDKYVKQVQNGTIDIESIKDEKLREKIEEYTEWYLYMPTQSATAA